MTLSVSSLHSPVSLRSTWPSCSTNRPSPSCPPAPPPTCRPPSTPSSPASRDCESEAAWDSGTRSLAPLHCSFLLFSHEMLSSAASSPSISLPFSTPPPSARLPSPQEVPPTQPPPLSLALFNSDSQQLLPSAHSHTHSSLGLFTPAGSRRRGVVHISDVDALPKSHRCGSFSL